MNNEPSRCRTLFLSSVLFNLGTIVASQGMPLVLGPDLPGSAEGKTETYWLAPYVRASQGFGGTTITWLAKDGRINRQAAVTSLQPGFVTTCPHWELPNWLVRSVNRIKPALAVSLEPSETVQGVNEGWHIALPGKSGPSGYVTSTPDSRVFVHEFHPQQGLIALDVYISGKRVNTVGPFLQYLANDVELNDDGSAGFLIWKDESKTNAQVVALDTNGAIRFRADCGHPVWSVIVAPGAAGALLRPNTGGSEQNTFMWFTGRGKLQELNISPNPQCVGWVPGSRESLFWTSVGNESQRYQLIDWDTGKRLWDIPCPGGGKALAIGLCPKFIIFAVAELYHPGPWRGAQWPHNEDGKEWIRTFYAVSVADGSLIARWQADIPRKLDADRDRFLRLNGKLFFMSSDEFTQFNLEDIIAKKNGWR